VSILNKILLLLLDIENKLESSFNLNNNSNNIFIKSNIALLMLDSLPTILDADKKVTE